MRIRECLVVCLAVPLLAWSSGVRSVAFAQDAPAPAQGAQQGAPSQQGTPPQPGAPGQPAEGAAAPAAQETPEQRDFNALSAAVAAVVKGEQPAGAIPVRWVDHHFIRSQGDSVYVPFTIEVDRKQLSSPSTAFYVRVVNKNATAAPAAAAAPAGAAGAAAPGDVWNTLHPVTVPDDGVVSRAVALNPGTYDVFVALKDRTTASDATANGRIGVLRHELVVPNFVGEELAMSSVLLARDIDQIAAPLLPEQQQDHPYTFVTLQVHPAHDGAFSKSGQLHLLFWIYNAGHEGGKPDVQVEYQFHHRQPDGELKYFNKTAPQALNAETLPPEFNLTAGHQLLSNLTIPLASFPEGGFRLAITVTDKKSGKTLTSNVDFTVSA
jgi:hypothetical protein